jgi:predicted nucleic acid-binding protein
MKVVFDPVVVARRIDDPTGPEAALFVAWEMGEFDPVVSDELLACYATEAGLEIADGFRQFGVVVPVDQPVVLTGNRGSDAALSAARAGGAEFLFAAEPALLRLRDSGATVILSARDFVSMLAMSGAQT